MSEERKLILQMVAEGKVTPEEADMLLQALDETERAAQSAATDRVHDDVDPARPEHLGQIIDKAVGDGLRGLDATLRRLEIDLDHRLNDPARGQLFSRIEEKMRRSTEHAVRRAQRAEERARAAAERAGHKAAEHAERAAHRMHRLAEEPFGPGRVRIFKAGLAIDRVSVVRTKTLTIPAAAGDRLVLGSRVGDVRVLFADVPEIEVEVKAQVWGEDEADANVRADAHEFVLVRRGPDVVLEVRRPEVVGVGIITTKGTRLDYTVRAPYGTNLDLESKAGDIYIVSGPKVGVWHLASKVGDIDIKVAPEAGFTYELSSTLGHIQTELQDDQFVLEEQQRSRRGAFRTGRAGDGSGRIEATVKTGHIRVMN